MDRSPKDNLVDTRCMGCRSHHGTRIRSDCITSNPGRLFDGPRKMSGAIGKVCRDNGRSKFTRAPQNILASMLSDNVSSRSRLPGSVAPGLTRGLDSRSSNGGLLHIHSRLAPRRRALHRIDGRLETTGGRTPLRRCQRPYADIQNPHACLVRNSRDTRRSTGARTFDQTLAAGVERRSDYGEKPGLGGYLVRHTVVTKESRPRVKPGATEPWAAAPALSRGLDPISSTYRAHLREAIQ